MTLCAIALADLSTHASKKTIDTFTVHHWIDRYVSYQFVMLVRLQLRQVCTIERRHLSLVERSERSERNWCPVCRTNRSVTNPLRNLYNNIFWFSYVSFHAYVWFQFSFSPSFSQSRFFRTVRNIFSSWYFVICFTCSLLGYSLPPVFPSFDGRAIFPFL